MATIPGWLLRNSATIEPYEGAGGTGPVFGPPVVVRCLVERGRRRVTTNTGQAVHVDVTLYAPPGTVAPPGSRVTVDGVPSTVVTCQDMTGGGLPTPDHTEVTCH